MCVYGLYGNMSSVSIHVYTYSVVLDYLMLYCIIFCYIILHSLYHVKIYYMTSYVVLYNVLICNMTFFISCKSILHDFIA